MRIAVAGGGPGGLYLAALVKQLDAGHEVTVWERNAPDDTFGFGVVFSDETLGGIEHADPVVFREMARHFARWDDIDVHHRGRVTTSGGHGFAAMSRRELLHVLQRRCADLGVAVHFRAEAPDPELLRGTHDLVVAADGARSAVRSRYADVFRPTFETRRCRYMWLGTDLVFEAFEFYVEETPYGVMQIHGYPYDRTGSTFIVEVHEDVWQRAFGDVAALDLPPGESDTKSIALVEELFSEVLVGHRVHANNSKWLNFVTLRNETWRHGNVVLLGDAAHTAHFSIGSGTKLAMEDALALAACLHEQPDLDSALAAYEAERRPVVLSTQRAAQASLEWFEDIGRYVHQEPEQFAFNIITRSRRVTHDNLRLRDPEFVAGVDAWFARSQPEPVEPRPPMFHSFRLGGLELANRVVVSAMDVYSAVDGLPTDFHLVHLGSKALGGAGLVMTEMVCVSPEGRITPGCSGLYTPEQEAAWARVVDFVHGATDARIGVQLGHSGRKGSTKLMWEGIDEPLPEGNWEVVAPSPIPYSPANAVPRELADADLAAIREQFVANARAAARAGFDVLELHCAHGYLLSSFVSPLSNRRTDRYGGSLADRLRYPLEVFDAVRAAWPAERPMTVRISATDWFEGGTDVDDAVAVARAFAEHGADGIDVSTGQVVKEERPAFGRSYQTPYADRIRNEVGREFGVAVIAVGAISSWDDVNSILLAGRADLCALGRPHLYDPQWTLHAAAEQGYRGPGATWPAPFRAGSRPPQTGRTDGPRPRLELVRRGGPAGTRHARWRP
ncbi:bifunctional salicylyl-CoA 5-hydroxylase/oxidoreductase [Geodermatophilus sp. SYSU D00703]